MSVWPVDPVEVRVIEGTADAVILAAVMPSMGHARPLVGTVGAGGGCFVAEEILFTMDGVWELSITLSGPRGGEVLNVSTVSTG